MRRWVVFTVLFGAFGVLAALPSEAARPTKDPLSVSITSFPVNPTSSIEATFGLEIGGSPSTVECQQSPGVGDRFQRSGALGTADAGGSWNATSAFRTDGARALSTASADTTSLALLETSFADADVFARASLEATPRGGEAGAFVAARALASDYLAARLVVQPGGQVRLQLVHSALGVEDVLGTAGVAGPKYKAGQVFWLRLHVLGSTVQAMAWPDGKTEPGSWQLSVVDLTPPSGTSVGFGSYGASGLSNSVEVSVDDFSAFDPSAAGAVTSCSGGAASYADLALGGHLFRVSASASSAQETAIYAWTVNPPAPSVTITAAPEATTASQSAVFQWSTEGIVDSTVCSLDEATPLACSSPASYTGLLPGPHTFTVTVSNVSGSGSDSHEWLIEEPAPTVTITEGPPTNTTSRSAQLSVTITGTPDSVACSLDGEPYPSGGGDCRSSEGTVELADVELGSRTFGLTATNAYGSASDSWTWNVFPRLTPFAIGFTPDVATSVDDPVILLRYSASEGNRLAALDCDVGIIFSDEIVSGCLTPYSVNSATDCSAYNFTNLPPASYTPDPAPSCITLETGDKSGSLRQGLAERFESPCSANNWSSFPVLSASDPRIIRIVVTTASALTIAPVIAVAKFYVTGWDISSITQGCSGNDSHPIYGSSYSLSRDNGDIWGHFVP